MDAPAGPHIDVDRKLKCQVEGALDAKSPIRPDPSTEGSVQRCPSRRPSVAPPVGVVAKHKSRHSFCSHLAMRGAPAIAIKELAGHASVGRQRRKTSLSG